MPKFPLNPDNAAPPAEILHPDRIPQHVAIIMDGNGRWASAHGMSRSEGHAQGALAVRGVLEAAGELGIRYLTLFSFSSENWKRPRPEIEALMGLFVHYLAAEREALIANNIRLLQIGEREGLPEDALKELDATLDATSGCTGPTLVLAVNYGSRNEITRAVRRIAERVQRGEIDPGEITDETIAENLDTAGIPDPDLLIRTSGESRLSNYLLWQISYAELYITPTLWPDFDRESLIEAVNDYAGRERRFGGLSAR